MSGIPIERRIYEYGVNILEVVTRERFGEKTEEVQEPLLPMRSTMMFENVDWEAVKIQSEEKRELQSSPEVYSWLQEVSENLINILSLPSAE